MGVTGNRIVCGALLGAISLAIPAVPAMAQAPAKSPSPPAPLPKFLDNRHLDSLEAARGAAEEDAKRRAAKRQRRAEEAEAKRAAEAEAMRKAEEIRKLTDETEARRKASEPGTAEATGRVGPAPWYGGEAVLSAGTAAAAAAGGILVTAPPGPCPPAAISTEPLPAGRMSIAIDSPCRAGTRFAIDYGSLAFSRVLDNVGRSRFVLDLFQGAAAPVTVVFSSGEGQALEARGRDLDKLSKVAVVWHAPVNLDLHAYEYAASASEPGHVWSKAPSSLEATVQLVSQRRRGSGYLSTTDDGQNEGAKVEVYTFMHHEEQVSGAVSLALDYESRGSVPAAESCGAGRNAEIALEVFVLERTGGVQREAALIPAAKCGEALPDRVRYNDPAVPDLRLRR